MRRFSNWLLGGYALYERRKRALLFASLFVIVVLGIVIGVGCLVGREAYMGPVKPGGLTERVLVPRAVRDATRIVGLEPISAYYDVDTWGKSYAVDYRQQKAGGAKDIDLLLTGQGLRQVRGEYGPNGVKLSTYQGMHEAGLVWVFVETKGGRPSVVTASVDFDEPH